jgi:phosphoribosylformylglycinamidine synthase
MATVFEAARNLAVVGARPLAATDCLNFPNPEKGATGWRLTEVIEGMSLALEALGVPVVSGNVSLYNESAARRIYPTPVVGMVGSVAPEKACGHAFTAPGHAVVLVGYGAPRLDGSEHLGPLGCPPAPDPEREVALGELLVAANDAGLLASAHDIGTGGLAVALAECCMPGGVGAEVEVPAARRPDETLFGEGGGRVIVSCAPRDVERLEALVPGGLSAVRIGETGGVAVTMGSETVRVTASIAELTAAYEAAIPGALDEH